MTTSEKQYLRLERLRLRHERRAVPVFRKALVATSDMAVTALRLGIAEPWNAPSETHIRAAMVTVYSDCGEAFASIVSDRMTKSAGGQWLAYVQTYVRTYVADRITGILDTTREMIRGVIAAGLEEGLGIDEIARRIIRTAMKTSRWRARVIARTETVSASNAGSLSGAAYWAREAGAIVEKVWLSTSDKRTRDAHRAVNGQVRPLDGHFDVGGAKLLHPGDPAGGASNTVNCRCAVFFYVVP